MDVSGVLAMQAGQPPPHGQLARSTGIRITCTATRSTSCSNGLLACTIARFCRTSGDGVGDRWAVRVGMIDEAVFAFGALTGGANMAARLLSTDIRRIPAVLRPAWRLSPALTMANRRRHGQRAVEACG